MKMGKEKLKTAYMISEQLVMRFEQEKRGEGLWKKQKRVGFYWFCAPKCMIR